MDYIATGTSCTTEGGAPGENQHESWTVLLSCYVRRGEDSIAGERGLLIIT